MRMEKYLSISAFRHQLISPIVQLIIRPLKGHLLKDFARCAKRDTNWMLMVFVLKLLYLTVNLTKLGTVTSLAAFKIIFTKMELNALSATIFISFSNLQTSLNALVFHALQIHLTKISVFMLSQTLKKGSAQEILSTVALNTVATQSVLSVQLGIFYPKINSSACRKPMTTLNH